MTLGQISRHYANHTFDYAKALRYMKLLGIVETEARFLLSVLDGE